MNTSNILKSFSLIALLAAALAVPVLAQPGPGMGMGAGMQNGGPGAAGPAAGGPGARGMKGMRFNKDNTVGWALMTPEERSAMQTKMRAVKTVEECQLLQAEQHKTMEVRAKEKGVTLPTPRQNSCDRMKARGLIK